MTYKNKLFVESGNQQVVKVSTDLGWTSEGSVNIYVADKFDGFDVDLSPKEAMEVSRMLMEAAADAI